MNINTMTFAARDFSARRGARCFRTGRHIPQWICKERATKSGRKRTAARKVAPNLACGCVARRLQTTVGYAPSSRLATGQIGRNERDRIYEMDHLDLSHLFSVRSFRELSIIANLYVRLLNCTTSGVKSSPGFRSVEQITLNSGPKMNFQKHCRNATCPAQGRAFRGTYVSDFYLSLKREVSVQSQDL